MSIVERYNSELYHYGVKGMKWGVRRRLGVKARAAAQYDEFASGANKNIKRLERKKERSGLNARQERKLEQNRKIYREATSTRKQLVKNLSEKDIKQGERWLKAMPFMVGGIATGVARSINIANADRILADERHGSRSRRQDN